MIQRSDLKFDDTLDSCKRALQIAQAGFVDIGMFKHGERSVSRSKDSQTRYWHVHVSGETAVHPEEAIEYAKVLHPYVRDWAVHRMSSGGVVVTGDSEAWRK